MSEWYKILGSAEFLGNPLGLLTNMGTDLFHLLYDPARGLLESPSSFTKSFGSQTLALVKNTTGGIFGSAGKITGAIAKGVKIIDADDEEQRYQRRQRREPKHAGEGLVAAGKALGRGVYTGLTGIVTRPIRGARQGAKGVFKGLAQGVAGIVLKPAAGLLDSASLALTGLGNTVAWLEGIPIAQRSRLPRYLGSVGEVVPYLVRDAQVSGVIDAVYRCGPSYCSLSVSCLYQNLYCLWHYG